MTATTDLNISAPAREKGYLHNRWIDFFCLGGGSLPVLCFLLMLPGEKYFPYTATVALLLSHFINNPHFAHSYQIFYADFGKKSAPGAPLRWRFLFAGLGVPVIIVSYFVFVVVTENPRLLGLAVNVMLFTVGWHYVKQGYGILMVEAVLKRAFFNDTEKTWLRYTALSVWIFSWAFANRELNEANFYGLDYVTLDIPDLVFWAMLATMSVATAGAAILLIAKARRGPLPVNGILAYVTSAYVWLILCRFDPMLLWVVPLFHSLQYLAVVWRYQLNKEEALAADNDTTRLLGLIPMRKSYAAMAKFVWMGTVVAAAWFVVIPVVLDSAIDYREEIFGATMFWGMIIVFINIHHYFLDNVMWRRENPDMKEHLFH